jgi:hypothetical protein
MVIHPVNQDPRERAAVAVHRMTNVAVTEAAMAVIEAATAVIEACSVTVTEGVAASKLLRES